MELVSQLFPQQAQLDKDLVNKFKYLSMNLKFIKYSVNGDIIVTLLPVNTRWPWITPAKFRPELVPEELMAQGLTVSHLLENYTMNIKNGALSVDS
jgi:hypothetical protein